MRDTRGGARVLAQYADTRRLASVSTYQSVFKVGKLSEVEFRPRVHSFV